MTQTSLAHEHGKNKVVSPKPGDRRSWPLSMLQDFGSWFRLKRQDPEWRAKIYSRTVKTASSIAWLVTLFAAFAGIYSIKFSADQVKYAADTLQLQQTFAIIDDQRQFSGRLFSDPETAQVVRTNAGPFERRQKALALLDEYEGTLLKFSLLLDKGVVSAKFEEVFRYDFCVLHKNAFFRGWWENRKRAEPYASLTQSYKKLDATCVSG